MTASVWAKLLSELRRNGQTMPISDSLIAATSLQHQLIVVTRNVAHFVHAGVRVVNPFEDK
jgi:predicted nucleic acid-binding protein